MDLSGDVTGCFVIECATSREERFNIEWGPMSAAAVLDILPTMVLFAFASRWIVAGLTQGATKG